MNSKSLCNKFEIPFKSSLIIGIHEVNANWWASPLTSREPELFTHYCLIMQISCKVLCRKLAKDGVIFVLLSAKRLRSQHFLDTLTCIIVVPETSFWTKEISVVWNKWNYFYFNQRNNRWKWLWKFASKSPPVWVLNGLQLNACSTVGKCGCMWLILYTIDPFLDYRIDWHIVATTNRKLL